LAFALPQRRRPARKRKDLCRAAKVSLELAFPQCRDLWARIDDNCGSELLPFVGCCWHYST